MSKIDETNEYHFGLRQELKRTEKTKKILTIVVIILVICLIVCGYLLVTKTDILKKFEKTTTTTTTMVATSKTYTKDDVDKYIIDIYSSIKIDEEYTKINESLTDGERRNVNYLLRVENTIGSTYASLINGKEALPEVNIIESTNNKDIVIKEYIEGILKHPIEGESEYITNIYNKVLKTKKDLAVDNSVYSYKEFENVGKNIFEGYKITNKEDIRIMPSSGDTTNLIANIKDKYQKDNEYFYIVEVIENTDFNSLDSATIKDKVNNHTIKLNYLKITYKVNNDVNYLTGIYILK